MLFIGEFISIFATTNLKSWYYFSVHDEPAAKFLCFQCTNLFTCSQFSESETWAVLSETFLLLASSGLSPVTAIIWCLAVSWPLTGIWCCLWTVVPLFHPVWPLTLHSGEPGILTGWTWVSVMRRRQEELRGLLRPVFIVSQCHVFCVLQKNVSSSNWTWVKEDMELGTVWKAVDVGGVRKKNMVKYIVWNLKELLKNILK